VIGPGVAGAMLAAHWSPDTIYVSTSVPMFLAAAALALLFLLGKEGNATEQQPQRILAGTD
jgi:hypothetical protein